MKRNVIVSIAGGGDYGVGPIAYLAKLEDDLKAKGDEWSWYSLIREEIALFAGTSVGAILAAGLSVGKEPRELLEEFLEEVKGIFGERTAGGLLGLDPKWNDTYVNEALPRILGSKVTFKDANPLVILAWDAAKKDLVVFGSNTPDVPIWWAVRASMAAPTYFAPWGTYYVGQTVPPAGIRSLYDGGLGENDPLVDGIASAYDQRLIQPGQRFRALELVTSGETPDVPAPVPGANDLTVAKDVVLPAITTGNSSRVYERACSWAASLGGEWGADVFRARPNIPDWDMDDLSRIPQIRKAWEDQYAADRDKLLSFLALG